MLLTYINFELFFKPCDRSWLSYLILWQLIENMIFQWSEFYIANYFYFYHKTELFKYHKMFSKHFRKILLLKYLGIFMYHKVFSKIIWNSFKSKKYRFYFLRKYLEAYDSIIQIRKKKIKNEIKTIKITVPLYTKPNGADTLAFKG